MIVLLAEKLSTNAVFWLMMALLGLLIGCLLLAVLLGRTLGPRGYWARRLKKSADKPKLSPKSRVDPWTESARRLKVEGTEGQRDEGTK